MRYFHLNDWLHWLENFHPKTIDLGLERVGQIARRLHLTSFPCPVITVSGTNGKGSCVALLYHILRAKGLRVGLYTSPHLFNYNERVCINDALASDEALCEAFAHIDEARDDISLSYFEFGTLAALWQFQKANLDAVILEVGLGGRLDAVNVVDSDIAVISTIALDHQDYLGNTREAIGFEKAGIMRERKPVVCGDFDVPESVRKQAHKLAAPLFCQSKDFGYQENAEDWQWCSQRQLFPHLPIPRIHLQNASTALMAIELLSSLIPITQAEIKKGLQTVFLPGRFEVYQKASITIVFDVAHNPAAAEFLAKQLQTQSCVGQTFAVIAMLADKDKVGVIKALKPVIDKWYVAGLDVARGESAEALITCLQRLNIENFSKHTTVTQAYEAAFHQAKPGDRIVVFGSFYTVAEVEEFYR